MQLKRELRANKSKEIQGKSLAFPWIPLAELGLFNELRRIQIKNPLRPHLAFRVVGRSLSARSPLHSPCRRTRQRRGPSSRDGKRYNTYFCFRKAFALFFPDRFDRLTHGSNLSCGIAWCVRARPCPKSGRLLR